MIEDRDAYEQVEKRNMAHRGLRGFWEGRKEDVRSTQLTIGWGPFAIITSLTSLTSIMAECPVDMHVTTDLTFPKATT